ncbi:MAG: sugar phosphate isomerase/epimerase [Pedosphaera sp.]|jgi:sugar phosphate isomerase/epimerase|nr:sugar phosphate isomerase/epimerase [Pedosphaera sp.]|tara:strand:+ start:609 stop:1661 length:1053 start_codon:yes stop_codon:yes gene_type:complete
MAKPIYHSSIEGAQHGGKGLDGFLKFAKEAGAAGAQPSNYMLEEDGSDGSKFRSASDIKDAFEKNGLKLDGVSGHCAFWVHTSAWTGTKSGHAFIHGQNQNKSPEELEQWYEDYLLRLMDLCAELGIKILPMFWGVSHGWELATGYPWGFWTSPDGGDLNKEGDDRFVSKTAKIRAHAKSLGIYLAHEIHPGTAAMCAEEFGHLVEICDGDETLTVNADPSHCWEGEDWETRFTHEAVKDRVYACHVKNFVVRPNVPLRRMDGNWRNRAMQFTDLGSGDLNMVRYVEMLINIGYPNRYNKIMGTETAPLIAETESNYRDPDATAIEGIQYVRDQLCFPVSEGSFEDEMGA